VYILWVEVEGERKEGEGRGGGGNRHLNAGVFHARRLANVLLFYYLKNYVLCDLVDFHDTCIGLSAFRAQILQTVV
jgi:hypothetical protein